MFTCENCGKPLQKRDNAYFLMQVPSRSLAELQTFLKTNAVVYCPECLELIYRRSPSHQDQPTV